MVKHHEMEHSDSQLAWEDYCNVVENTRVLQEPREDRLILTGTSICGVW